MNGNNQCVKTGVTIRFCHSFSDDIQTAVGDMYYCGDSVVLIWNPQSLHYINPSAFVSDELYVNLARAFHHQLGVTVTPKNCLAADSLKSLERSGGYAS